MKWARLTINDARTLNINEGFAGRWGSMVVGVDKA